MSVRSSNIVLVAVHASIKSSIFLAMYLFESGTGMFVMLGLEPRTLSSTLSSGLLFKGISWLQHQIVC